MPDFLAIGHICHDKIPETFIPGGSVGYAAAFAAQQGCRVAALTSYGPDFLFEKDYQHINLCVVPAAKTTCFENVYQETGRVQYLHARAANLHPTDLPAAWRQTPVVMLCPIADEISPDFLTAFPDTFVCACPQGWMRRWDASGRVFPKKIKFWERICAGNLICFSENDVGCDWDFIEAIGGQAKLMVVTQASAGATVFERGQRRYFPAYPVEEINPTGAGDVFATAFALHYAETNDVEQAIYFAHAAASFCVERKNGVAFQTRETVLERAKKSG